MSVLYLCDVFGTGSVIVNLCLCRTLSFISCLFIGCCCLTLFHFIYFFRMYISVSLASCVFVGKTQCICNAVGCIHAALTKEFGCCNETTCVAASSVLQSSVATTECRRQISTEYDTNGDAGEKRKREPRKQDRQTRKN